MNTAHSTNPYNPTWFISNLGSGSCVLWTVMSSVSCDVLSRCQTRTISVTLYKQCAEAWICHVCGYFLLLNKVLYVRPGPASPVSLKQTRPASTPGYPFGLHGYWPVV